MLVIVPIVTAIQILIMPNQILGSDAAAIRLVSTHLVQWGEFGIPYTQKPLLPPSTLKVKGQFFIGNDQHERLYSRWGELNTLLFAIPEWFLNPSGYEPTEELIPLEGALNISFAILITIYLVLIAQGFKAPVWATSLFIVSSFYGTYVSTYLRATGYEIFQLFFFLAYFFHFMKYLSQKSSRHLVISQVLLIALIHIKLFFILMYIPSFLLVFLEKYRGSARARGYYILLAGLFVAFMSHHLIAFYKFGNFTVTGDAPLPEGWDSGWSLAHFPNRLMDYTIGAKASFALNFPPIILALGLWPAFARNHKREAIFILTIFSLTTIILLCFSSHGEWCTGPRYHLFLFPAMAFPILTALTEIKARAGKAVLIGVLVGLTGFFGFLQWHMASRPFFTRHWLIGFALNSAPDRPDIRKWLDETNDLSITYGFNRFMAGDPHFQIVDDVLGNRPPEEQARARLVIRREFDRVFFCNFYFSVLCPKTAQSGG